MKTELTQEEMIDILRNYIRVYGSQRNAAEALNVSFSYLNDILHKRRDPSDQFAQRLGYQRVVRFVQKEAQSNGTATDE